jgi:2-oxoisovalerate ferredoxin oxidoreductase alpha subunit
MKSLTEQRLLVTGNEAAAIGVRLSNVKFISAYPITPQTTIVEKLAEMVSKDELKARYVEVESEHSAMAAVYTAALAGSRSYTATSSHGLLYMHEMLHWTAGMRVPLVTSVVNRAIGPPWNVWADQSDSMNQKDTGWLQVYCESNQETLDTIIAGYKIAENKDVMLPLMSMEDAFVLSHTSEPVSVPNQSMVDEFLPEYKPEFAVDVNNPRGYGSYATPEGPFMELKHDMVSSMDIAKRVIKDTLREYADTFGREYSGLTENYMMDDADYAFITSGTLASTAKYVVSKLRKEGKKVGLIRIKFFRPFPQEEIREALKHVSAAGVIDRSVSFSAGGNLYSDVVASLYRKLDIPVAGFVAGIGGRDVRIPDFEHMFSIIQDGADGVQWIGLKEVG